MKIVVLGGTGLLGKELQKIDSKLKCYGSDVNVSDKTTLFNKLNEINPDIILHLAAIKDSIYVDNNPIETIETNIIGTANVSIWCSENNRRLVFVSTDYVYDCDSEKEHIETEGTNPYNLYAQSKLGGECSVSFVKNHCIIRTSFGESKFPYKSAYDNLYVSKDYVDVIAPMIYKVLISDFTGIINVGTEPKTILEYAQRRNQITAIQHIKSKNFILNTTRYNELFNS
jgi:dTDP-4-dehydrorhamnose reductase